MMDWQTFREEYLSTEGRINRWPFFWKQFVIGIIISVISGLNIFFFGETFKFLSQVIQVVLVVLNVAVMISFGIRRCHDLDRSGWWMLLSFIPLINFFFGIYLLFIRGTYGANRFGPDPLH